jgi:hypothetical protein
VSETLVSLWTDVRKRLEAAGIDTPVLDARLLLEAGAGVRDWRLSPIRVGR